jgi:PAS domain S-box-containing protein
MTSAQIPGKNSRQVRRELAMTRGRPLLSNIPSPVLGYGLSVLSVAIALGVALFLDRFQFRGLITPFLFAIAVSAWYAGASAAVLAILLSGASFDYFFTKPLHSFVVAPSQVPYLFILVLFGSLVTWFSENRRRIERELLRSRDELRKEVTMRTRQASLLNLTHDPIFVRDMEGVITYCNRGAEELYGWSAEQAIGKSTDDLLRTIFPKPFDEVEKELLQTDRWEGELQNRIGREALVNAFSHSRADCVEFEIEYADSDLRMRVRDNGRGIDPQVLRTGRDGHWGLAGMRERAAKIGGMLNISSTAAAGTEVQLSIPGRIAFQASDRSNRTVTPLFPYQESPL